MQQTSQCAPSKTKITVKTKVSVRDVSNVNNVEAGLPTTLTKMGHVGNASMCGASPVTSISLDATLLSPTAPPPPSPPSPDIVLSVHTSRSPDNEDGSSIKVYSGVETTVSFSGDHAIHRDDYVYWTPEGTGCGPLPQPDRLAGFVDVNLHFSFTLESGSYTLCVRQNGVITNHKHVVAHVLTQPPVPPMHPPSPPDNPGGFKFSSLPPSPPVGNDGFTFSIEHTNCGSQYIGVAYRKNTTSIGEFGKSPVVVLSEMHNGTERVCMKHIHQSAPSNYKLITLDAHQENNPDLIYTDGRLPYQFAIKQGSGVKYITYNDCVLYRYIPDGPSPPPLPMLPPLHPPLPPPRSPPPPKSPHPSPSPSPPALASWITELGIPECPAEIVNYESKCQTQQSDRIGTDSIYSDGMCLVHLQLPKACYHPSTGLACCFRYPSPPAVPPSPSAPPKPPPPSLPPPPLAPPPLEQCPSGNVDFSCNEDYSHRVGTGLEKSTASCASEGYTGVCQKSVTKIISSSAMHSNFKSNWMCTNARILNDVTFTSPAYDEWTNPNTGAAENNHYDDVDECMDVLEDRDDCSNEYYGGTTDNKCVCVTPGDDCSQGVENTNVVIRRVQYSNVDQRTFEASCCYKHFSPSPPPNPHPPPPNLPLPPWSVEKYGPHLANQVKRSVAKADCESRGGHLPRLNTLKQAQLFCEAAIEMNVAAHEAGTYLLSWAPVDYIASTQDPMRWIDITLQNGEWKHSDGSVPGYINWASTHPRQGYQCAIFSGCRRGNPIYSSRICDGETHYYQCQGIPNESPPPSASPHPPHPPPPSPPPPSPHPPFANLETHSTKEGTYEQAKADCESRGGHLPRLNTPADYTAFSTATRLNNQANGVDRSEKHPSPVIPVYHWLDLKDDNLDGQWLQSNGHKPTYIQWTDGDNYAFNAKCAVFDEGNDHAIGLGQIGRVYRHYCSQTAKYLCQGHPNPPPSPPSLPPPPPPLSPPESPAPPPPLAPANMVCPAGYGTLDISEWCNKARISGVDYVNNFWGQNGLSDQSSWNLRLNDVGCTGTSRVDLIITNQAPEYVNNPPNTDLNMYSDCSDYTTLFGELGEDGFDPYMPENPPPSPPLVPHSEHEAHNNTLDGTYEPPEEIARKDSVERAASAHITRHQHSGNKKWHDEFISNWKNGYCGRFGPSFKIEWTKSGPSTETESMIPTQQIPFAMARDDDASDSWMTKYNMATPNGSLLSHLHMGVANQTHYEHKSTHAICKKICYDSRFPDRSLLEPGRICNAFIVKQYEDDKRGFGPSENQWYYDGCKFYESTITEPMIETRIQSTLIYSRDGCEQRCSQLNGEMLAPRSAKMQERIEEAFSSNSNSFNEYSDAFWLGAKGEVTDSSGHQWLDGTSMLTGYQNWKTGEPSQGGCPVINPTNGNWYIYSNCDYQFGNCWCELPGYDSYHENEKFTTYTLSEDTRVTPPSDPCSHGALQYTMPAGADLTMKWQFVEHGTSTPVEMPGFYMSVWDMDRSPLNTDWSTDGNAEYGAHVEFSGLYDSGAALGEYYSHGFAHGDTSQASGATRSIVVSDNDASTAATSDGTAVIVLTGPDVRGGRAEFKNSWLQVHDMVQSYPSKVNSAPVSLPMPDLSNGMGNISAAQQNTMFSVSYCNRNHFYTKMRVLVKDKTKTSHDNYIVPGQTIPIGSSNYFQLPDSQRVHLMNTYEPQTKTIYFTGRSNLNGAGEQGHFWNNDLGACSAPAPSLPPPLPDYNTETNVCKDACADYRKMVNRDGEMLIDDGHPYNGWYDDGLNSRDGAHLYQYGDGVYDIQSYRAPKQPGQLYSYEAYDPATESIHGQWDEHHPQAERDSQPWGFQSGAGPPDVYARNRGSDGYPAGYMETTYGMEPRWYSLIGMHANSGPSTINGQPTDFINNYIYLHLTPSQEAGAIAKFTSVQQMLDQGYHPFHAYPVKNTWCDDGSGPPEAGSVASLMHGLESGRPEGYYGDGRMGFEVIAVPNAYPAEYWSKFPLTVPIIGLDDSDTSARSFTIGDWASWAANYAIDPTLPVSQGGQGFSEQTGGYKGHTYPSVWKWVELPRLCECGHDCSDCGTRAECTYTTTKRRKLSKLPYKKYRKLGYEAKPYSAYDIDFIHELKVGKDMGLFASFDLPFKYHVMMNAYNQSDRTVRIPEDKKELEKLAAEYAKEISISRKLRSRKLKEIE